jgi:hypothetical protein
MSRNPYLDVALRELIHYGIRDQSKNVKASQTREESTQPVTCGWRDFIATVRSRQRAVRP